VASLESLLTGGVLGVAIGDAAAVALEPVFLPITQDAWDKAVSGGATKLLDANQLAELVAQALLSLANGESEAQRDGYGATEFNKLVQLALKAPSPPDAEKLYLRQKANPAGSITAGLLDHAYAKAGIEHQYWAALTAAAQTTLLTPAQLALGAVRSTLDDQGLLVTSLDVSGSNVPQYQKAPLNIIDEAAAAGVNAERLRALIGSIGLPMSTHEAASAYFRNIITLGAYNQSILEGDVRPEWAPFILDQARQILTAHDHVELRLRGWYGSDQEMYDGTAQHGMSPANTDLMFKVLGRPISQHQVFIGLRRGGVYDGDTSQIDPAYLKSQQESNIRPEWYNLEWSQRETLPSLFVVRQWLKDGGDTTVAHDWLYEEGYREVDIQRIITQYAPSGTTTTGKNLTYSQIHQAWRANQLSSTEAITQLEALGYSPQQAQLLLNTWQGSPPSVTAP
jgi:hypothetical protein